jgi:death on curing protein
MPSGYRRAQAFVDGNRRTACVTALTFPRLKGYAFCPDPIDGVRMIEALATGKVDEAGFAAWLTAGSNPV